MFVWFFFGIGYTLAKSGHRKCSMRAMANQCDVAIATLHTGSVAYVPMFFCSFLHGVICVRYKNISMLRGRHAVIRHNLFFGRRAVCVQLMNVSQGDGSRAPGRRSSMFMANADV